MEEGIKGNFALLNVGPESPSAALHYYFSWRLPAWTPSPPPHPPHSPKAEYPTGTQSRPVDELNQGGEGHNSLWPCQFLQHRVAKLTES